MEEEKKITNIFLQAVQEIASKNPLVSVIYIKTPKSPKNKS